MPRAIRRCGAKECDEPMPCPTHSRVERRPSRQSRGYDAVHEARAAELRRDAERDGKPCSLCLEKIDFSLRSPHPRSFVAHHLTRDKRGPLAPAHRRCNEHAGQPSAAS